MMAVVDNTPQVQQETAEQQHAKDEAAYLEREKVKNAAALAAYHQKAGSTMLADGTVLPPQNIRTHHPDGSVEMTDGIVIPAQNVHTSPAQGLYPPLGPVPAYSNPVASTYVIPPIPQDGLYKPSAPPMDESTKAPVPTSEQVYSPYYTADGQPTAAYSSAPASTVLPAKSEKVSADVEAKSVLLEPERVTKPVKSTSNTSVAAQKALEESTRRAQEATAALARLAEGIQLEPTVNRDKVTVDVKSEPVIEPAAPAKPVVTPQARPNVHAEAKLDAAVHNVHQATERLRNVVIPDTTPKQPVAAPVTVDTRPRTPIKPVVTPKPVDAPIARQVARQPERKAERTPAPLLEVAARNPVIASTARPSRAARKAEGQGSDVGLQMALAFAAQPEPHPAVCVAIFLIVSYTSLSIHQDKHGMVSIALIRETHIVALYEKENHAAVEAPKQRPAETASQTREAISGAVHGFFNQLQPSVSTSRCAREVEEQVAGVEPVRALVS